MGSTSRDEGAPNEPGMSRAVHRNIEELTRVRAREQQRMSLSTRIAGGITRFAGSMLFVYVHLLVYGGWLLINSGAVPIAEPWDPFPFVMLAMAASVEAIFLSTFILISQNRMQRLADQRAELDLQVSLLTEHELTRAVKLLDEMAMRAGVSRPPEHEMDDVKRDINPRKLVEEIQNAEAQVEKDT